MDIMDVMDIMDIMNIMDIMDIMDILITTAWMAIAGAVSSLFLYKSVARQFLFVTKPNFTSCIMYHVGILIKWVDFSLLATALIPWWLM